MRGSILAADGTVLAESVTGYEVDVAPATLLRAPLAIDRLAALLGYNDTLTLHGEVQRAATHGTRVLRLRRCCGKWGMSTASRRPFVFGG